MELDGEHELWTMIEELAYGDAGLQRRAAETHKRLHFLEPRHFPEAFQPELQQIKELAQNTDHMDKETARNFILRILSLYQRVRDSHP